MITNLTQPKTKVAFYTLGCRLNQSETAVVENTFDDDNYHVVDIKQSADIVVINTCTVTANGDADTRRLINKINRINPNSKIALIGCQAQVQKEKLSTLKNVRWIIGNAKKFNLKEIVEEHADPETPQIITPTIERDAFTIPVAGVDRHHTRANIKIQDGCDFFCSFCEIPYARGRARSRVFDDILKECRSLVHSGHKEIVITGINVGTYSYKKYHLLDVIDAMEQINGLERIRISSIEPTTIDERIFDKMNENKKLCRYLHIPLQSGDDNVLTNMKRKYSTTEFNAFIQKANEKVEEICIGTDVIVGFPGETEEQFERTYTHLLEWPIHYFHVFSYSSRHMAKSRLLSLKEINPAVIHQRSTRLRELSNRKKNLFYRNFLNSNVEVLFEQQKDGFWHGISDHYLKVKVKSDISLENQLHTVLIKEHFEHSLIGELIE